jgi:uncharacterized membrane protein
MRFLLRFALLLLFCASLIRVPAARAQADPSGDAIRTIHPTFATIDVPGAGYTEAMGINTAGGIVGSYGQDTASDSNGFLYSNGTFTYFDYLGETVTVPLGINDSGLIVGYAGREPVVGFLYDGSSFTTLQDGGDSATYSDGINNVGDVVGGAGTIYTTKGFELIGARFKTLNVPGQYVYISGTGINNDSEIVGFTDTTGFKCHSGRCQTFAAPGATRTVARGINDNGIIVGWYEVAEGCNCAFASLNGQYLSFSYPGAAFTAAGGVNSSGQVVGEYTFDYNAWHGFVTSPITAASFR